jgi:hypothetical protein
MQIIESSMVGVRSSAMRLTRRGSPLRFEIYPMVHVGEPAFYATVTRRLRECDLIVAEGVGGADPPPDPERPSRWNAGLSTLTASYELPAKFERAGLVRQHIPFDQLGVPVR